MCGIVGVAGRVWAKEEKVFNFMFQVDTVRGPHSSGVMSVRRQTKEPTYLKIAGTPWDLYSCEQWRGLANPAHLALLGHNRWATIGVVNNDNAHPFMHGHITGVHNGTIKNKLSLVDGEKFETDSEAIYFNLATQGIKETLKKIDGAFALVWWNNKEKAIQMVRNHKRPLYYTTTKDKMVLLWASEPWMLEVGAAKHALEIEKPTEVKTETLYTMPIEEGKEVSVVEEKVDFFTPVWNYESYSRPWDHGKVRFSQSYMGGFIGEEIEFSVIRDENKGGVYYILAEAENKTPVCPDIRIFTGKKSQLGKLLLKSPNTFRAKVKAYTSNDRFGTYLMVDHRTIEEVKKNIIPFVPRNKDETKELMPVYNGHFVELGTWYQRTRDGCAWCSSSPVPHDATKLLWFGTNQFLCEDCQHNPEVRPYILN